MNAVQQIRAATDADQKRKLKNTLPCFTPAGTFDKYRNLESFHGHSGIICLDLDHATEPRAAIQADPYTFACHLSCSGTGLAIYVKSRFVPTDAAGHKMAYLEVLDYYQQRYNVKLDSSCQDLPRLRIVSFDPGLYLNENSLTFGTQPKLTPQQATHTLFGHDVEAAFDFLEARGYDILDNDYNVCQRMAYALLSEFPSMEAEGYMRRLWGLSAKYSAYDDQELSRRWKAWQQHHLSKGSSGAGTCGIATFWYQVGLKSGYKNIGRRSVVERTLRTAKRDGVAPETAAKDAAKLWGKEASDAVLNALQTMASDIYEEDDVKIEAWWFVDDKEKLVLDEIKLLTVWLPEQGFMRVKQDNVYQLVRVRDHIVTVADTPTLKQHIMSYISTLPWEFDGLFRTQLETAVVRNSKAIFTQDKYDFIPLLPVGWVQDDRHTARFFYRNGCLEVKANGYRLVQYADLNGFVWDYQLKARDWQEKAPEGEAEFGKLLWLMSAQDEARYTALYTSLAYLLHSYKDPSRATAVVLQDEVMGDDPQGGTGKDLVLKALGHLRSIVFEPGKAFDPAKSFAFQRVDQGTDVVVLQDVRKGLPFESLFNLITDGIVIEKKHRDAYYLPFEESPKIAITTNYPLKGIGASHKRRKGEIEVAPYFGPHHTPHDEFGHTLFTEWSPVEWAKFDYLMVGYVCYYLAHGLVAAPDINRSSNALRASTEDGYAEWMDTWLETAPRDERGMLAFRNNQLHANYIHDTGSGVPLDRFGKWTRIWASLRKMQMEKRSTYYRGEKAQWCFLTYAHPLPT